MDFLEDKANSVAGRAIERISDRTTNVNDTNNQNQNEMQPTPASSADPTKILIPSTSNYTSNALTNRRSDQNRHNNGAFGGDMQIIATPAPIGFKFAPSGFGLAQNNDCQQQTMMSSAESDCKLYEGNAWTRLWFQRIMLLSLLRLLVFIRKLYEDFQATKSYEKSGQAGYFLVGLLTLLAPTLVFTVYRICRFLQQALPDFRATPGKSTTNQVLPTNTTTSSLAYDRSDSRPAMNDKQTNQQVEEEEETELDGLVTARQTPDIANQQVIDHEFQDSHSHQISTTGSPDSPFPQAASPQALLPSELKTSTIQVEAVEQPKVDVDKLGNLGDREGTRVVIGAGEQLVHGALYVFWQLKRQVDVIGYLVDRSCLWRRPSDQEQRELELLRTGSDGLEWFQDFYAAFLAILVQVYTLGSHWRGGDSNSQTPFQMSPYNGRGPLVAEAGDPSNDLKVGQAAKALGESLNNYRIAGPLANSPDLLILSELVISSAVIVSLLIAVRRKDDGPLTTALSMLGWGSIFASRIIIIALAFVHLGWKLMILFVMIHLIAITAWIYRIALDSHNDKPSETEALLWRDQELRPSNGKPDHHMPMTNDSKPTDSWLPIEHVILITQTFTLFALPSLFYWPVMFNLKLHCRPLKYLVIIMSENFLLIPAVWYSISSHAHATPGQWYLLSATGAFSIVGFLFVFLYVSCKPTLTEFFVRADQLFNGAEQAGIYYELCSRVFKMPDLGDPKFRRLMRQTEEIVQSTKHEPEVV